MGRSKKISKRQKLYEKRQLAIINKPKIEKAREINRNFFESEKERIKRLVEKL